MTTKPLRFRPLAARELVDAEARYEAQHRGRGARFLDAVDAALSRIRQAPESFPLEPGTGGARSAKVVRYPYRIVFVEHGDVLYVVAVAHGRRRPQYWRRRDVSPRKR